MLGKKFGFFSEDTSFWQWLYKLDFAPFVDVVIPSPLDSIEDFGTPRSFNSSKHSDIFESPSDALSLEFENLGVLSSVELKNKDKNLLESESVYLDPIDRLVVEALDCFVNSGREAVLGTLAKSNFSLFFESCDFIPANQLNSSLYLKYSAVVRDTLKQYKLIGVDFGTAPIEAQQRIVEKKKEEFRNPVFVEVLAEISRISNYMSKVEINTKEKQKKNPEYNCPVNFSKYKQIQTYLYNYGTFYSLSFIRMKLALKALDQSEPAVAFRDLVRTLREDRDSYFSSLKQFGYVDASEDQRNEWCGQ